jgi:phosphate transport system protein
MSEHDHIVKAFDEELKELERMIAEMGGLAESQLARAVKALARRDADLADQVVADDKRLDALEAEVDDFVVRLLARRQPMAEDLRLIIAGIKIAANLERIGDHAKNIAKRTVTLSRAPAVGGATQSIARMARIVQEMIKLVLDAYADRDVAKANDVRARDAEVDQVHTSLFRELLTYMMEDARSISACTHLLFVAKNVERMGDHATGIAEQVHFVVEGHVPEDERPRGDRSSFTVITPGDAEG